MSIVVKNLDFSINDQVIFKNLTFSINEGDFISIIGLSGSGKTLLSKILTGQLFTNNNSIIIDNTILSPKSFNFLRNKISYIPENINAIIISKNVYEEITFSLRNLNFPLEKINLLVNEYVLLFKIKDLLYSNLDDLSGGELYKVGLISNLICNPKYLIIDNNLDMLDNNSKEEIYSILFYLNKKKGLTIINFSNNICFVNTLSNNIVLNNKSICLEFKGDELHNYEKELLEIGFKFPIIIDLSIKLKLYNLIDKIHIKSDELVVDIWK